MIFLMGAQQMCKSEQTSHGFFCNLDALQGPSKREHVERGKMLFSTNKNTTTWIANGFVMSFAKSHSLFLDVTKWIYDESICCEFLNFDLRLDGVGDQIILKVSEPDGAFGFLRSELRGLGVIS